MTAAAKASPPPGAAGPAVRLGLAANWPQFTLLVLVNVFVGGMVGLERATTSLVGTRVFHLSGYLAVFSFIIAFGVTKAATNLAAGPLTARHTRKTLLVAGWRPGCPSRSCWPGRRHWGWVVAANVLLGVDQGLAWSMTVNMKIDLVGPRNRGLALGLNEAAGYMAVGATALATGYLAAAYGLRPVPDCRRGLRPPAWPCRCSPSGTPPRTWRRKPPPIRAPQAGRDCRRRLVQKDLHGGQLAERLAARRQPGRTGQ